MLEPNDFDMDENDATELSLGPVVSRAVGSGLRQELEQAQETGLQSDQTLTDYEMTGEIGQGAMGAILSARHRHLKRQVAYKRILPEFIDAPDSLSRFLREMQITAQLEHPNIIPVYEFEFTSDGSMAYTMKLVKGKTLKDLIRQKRQLLTEGKKLPSELSQNHILEYFLSVCDAMNYAHSKGIIHRDLKPANLMIGEYNEVYVMDWGIARQIGRYQTVDDQEHSTGLTELKEDISPDETRAGQILGTPRYMSPQQAAGKNKELDGRSDQFSLGLILFELLTCTPAIQARNTLELLKKILKVEIEPFEAVHSGEKIARELKAIARKALMRMPDDRYDTVADMARDIRRYMHGEAIEAEPDRFLQKFQRWISHHRVKALTTLMGLIVLSSCLVGISIYNQQAALAKARAVELKLNGLFGRVSQQAQEIDGHFLKMEALLRYLAASAQQYLEQAAPAQEAYYPQHPFTAPDQYPAPLYGGKISLNYATAGFSPQKTAKDMYGKLERLLPLRHTLKEILLRSYTSEPDTLSDQDVQTLIGQEGTPVMWSHVSLEEGLIYMYPGIGFNTPGYDARTRPFYRLSAHKYGVFWGNPYFDPLSGSLLPATTALYDTKGQFLGVAGIDLRFQYVIDKLLTLTDEKRVRQTFLLNERAEVMIRSALRNQASDENKVGKNLTQGLETPVYDNSALAQAIVDQERGGYILDQSRSDQPRLLVYARLNTLGWYYLAELPLLPEDL